MPEPIRLACRVKENRFSLRVRHGRVRVRVLLYYEGFYPSSGGIEAHIRNICENLPCEFEVVSDLHDASLGEESDLPHSIVTRMAPNNTATAPIPSPANLRPLFPYRVVTDCWRFRRTGQYLRTARCDIMHFHGNGMGTSLMKFVRLTGAGRLLKALPLAVDLHVPKVATIHGLSVQGDEATSELQRRFLSSFDTFICVDEHLPEMAKRLGATSSASFEYIPNSVDLRRFCPTETPEHGPLRVGFVGRLERSRGIQNLRALAEGLPASVELHAVLAASRVQLQRFEHFLETPRIHVRTNLPYQAMPDFYRGIDVLFNPVEVPGISRATLEAMACGKPVIMTALGNRYPVEPGVTGFLVDLSGKDVSELVASLVGQKERLSIMGRTARHRVEREFSNEVVLPRIWRVYERLTTGGGPKESG